MKRIGLQLGLLLLSLLPGEQPHPTVSNLTGNPWAIPTGRLERPVPAIQHAIIISIDGLRPDVLLRANAPNIRRLIESGSFSFWARTTALSITLPSHTSMLTGVPPSRHGIIWNDDRPLDPAIYPRVPTLFDLAHRAGYSTAMVASKSKFAILNKPGTLDWPMIANRSGMRDADVAINAAKIIHEHKPQVMFVHFGETDYIGHQVGWGTPQQLATIEAADAGIGKLLAALEEEHLLDSTLILVTSDHGGQGRSHGPDDPRSRHIPWIAVGPGIRKNLDLTTYPRAAIQIEDTFATVCWILGIPTAPDYLFGTPIKEIVGQTELLHLKMFR